jgi:hypothetical protein
MQLDNGKFFSITRALDGSSLCRVKWNPFATVNAAGDVVTAATIEQASGSILFTVNGAAETIIGTYTGNSGADNEVVFVDTNVATVQNLIRVINGRGVGHPAKTAATYLRRWRAGLADFRPQFVIGAGDGLVVAPANALLGRSSVGLPMLADSSGLASADLISIGCGVPGAEEGGGQYLPDHFESDYEVTTSGVKTPTRDEARRREEQPGRPLFQVLLTDIQVGVLFATTKVVRVFDDAGNLLKSWSLGAAVAVPGSGQFSAQNPLVRGPGGSPLWVEVSGTGGSTAGDVTVSGYMRVG